MTGTLRVTPEKLINEATNFSNTAQTVESLTSSMVNTVNSLNSAWKGEAATAYYNRIQALQESIARMVRMIREHATDLNDMAREYQEAERAGQEAAAALNTDIIA